jgi:sigma-B regulation protein RsbU (phosphoserine phosphatase)
VLDVSGHGVPAALLSVSAMHSIEPILEKASQDGQSVQSPGRVATELNRRFRAGENDGLYLTMILCMLDTKDGHLYTTSAGHPLPFVLRAGELIAVPDSGGFPIAVVDGAEYEQSAIELRPGDRVCLYSDGIIEQDSPSGEQFGADRLLKSLMSRRDIAAEKVVGDVVDDLAAWAGSAKFVDDVSLVILDWVGHPDTK